MLLLIPISYASELPPELSFGWHDNALWGDDSIVHDYHNNLIRLRKQFDVYAYMGVRLEGETRSMFGLVRTPVSYSMDDFTWTWETNCYFFNTTLINDSMSPDPDIDDMYYYEERQTCISTGNNNNAEHNWTFIINVTQEHDTKYTLIQCNNGEDIYSPKVYWFKELIKNRNILYDGQSISPSLSNVDLTSLDDKPRSISIDGIDNFLFNDLEAEGHSLSNLYIGSGTSIGRDNNVISIGITPSVRTFSTGTCIEYDPESTGYLTIGGCGLFGDNDWTLGVNGTCAAMGEYDGYYAEGDAGDLNDATLYGFDDIVESSFEVNYIYSRFYSYAGLCAA